MRFEDELKSAGLIPGEVIADGRLHRCRTEAKKNHRNGWYVLHPDGRGCWGDHQVSARQALGFWRDESSDRRQLSPEVEKQIKEKREKDRAYRNQQMINLRTYWAHSLPIRSLHPYIAGKGLSVLGCNGLKQHDDLLVVPIMLGTQVISVQTIDSNGGKLFWPGVSVKSGAYIFTRNSSAITILCEGIATGLALFQSVKQASVVVCFDCGNLLHVVDRIKPTGSVVIAADNDYATAAKIGSNPGLQKARNAADLIGCGVVYPTGIEGSDYADAYREWGHGGAKKIEREVLAASKYVTSNVTVGVRS